MFEDLLRKFALKKFGKGHYPLPDGSNAGKLLGLIVKIRRSIFQRPLKESELTFVGGLEKFVPLGEVTKFLDSLKLHTKKDDNLMLAGREEHGAAR